MTRGRAKDRSFSSVWRPEGLLGWRPRLEGAAAPPKRAPATPGLEGPWVRREQHGGDVPPHTALLSLRAALVQTGHDRKVGAGGGEGTSARPNMWTAIRELPRGVTRRRTPPRRGLHQKCGLEGGGRSVPGLGEHRERLQHHVSARSRQCKLAVRRSKWWPACIRSKCSSASAPALTRSRSAWLLATWDWPIRPPATA